MILPNMTFGELCKEVSRDAGSIWSKIGHAAYAIRKPKEIRDRWPEGRYLKRIEHTSKNTGNHYFILPKVTYERNYSTKLGASAKVFVKTFDEHGGVLWMVVPTIKSTERYESAQEKLDKMSELGPGDLHIRPNEELAVIYTPHFLQRYEERFLKSGETDLQVILETYLKRTNVKVFNWTTYKELLGYETRVKDGIELGIVVRDGILQSNTFISDDMLRENQNYLGKEGFSWEQLMDFNELLKSGEV